MPSRVAYIRIKRCIIIGDGRHYMRHYQAKKCMAARWCAWAMCGMPAWDGHDGARCACASIVRCFQPQPLLVSGSSGVSHSWCQLATTTTGVSHSRYQPQPVSAYISNRTPTLVLKRLGLTFRLHPPRRHGDGNPGGRAKSITGCSPGSLLQQGLRLPEGPCGR